MWKLLILDKYRDVVKYLKDPKASVEITYLGKYPIKDKSFKEFILFHDENIDLLIKETDQILDELVENILLNEKVIFPGDNKPIIFARLVLKLLLDEILSKKRDNYE